MRYLRVNGMPEHIFKNEQFSQFRRVLDSDYKLKVLEQHKKAEPITFEEEKILWEKGILGERTPQSLLDTMVYMNGLYVVVRSTEICDTSLLKFN